VFVRAASGAASCQLAVNHDGRQAAHAVLFRTTGDVVLVHIMNLDFMVRACDFSDHLDGFLAGRAPGTEDFDFVFFEPSLFSFTIQWPR
jgi:hypothetical protein